MRSVLFPLALLLGCVALSACDNASDAEFDLSLYTGAYAGTVTTLTAGRADVEAPVVVHISEGELRNTVVVTVDVAPADPRGTDPDPIVVQGTYDEDGARFVQGTDNDAVVVTIGADGDIAGGGRVALFDLRLDTDIEGRLTRSRLDVDVDLDVVGGNDDVPDGTRGLIRLRTQRVEF
ncbi:MAG TPA: hypothetical protein VD962_09195 [Rubricoccaceae bacterium]|nr:hypothetical protein [Rubricoccaceae bacterium]